MEEKPFTVTSFGMRKEIEDSFAKAGEEFDSEEVILRKLSALAKFFEKG